MKRPSQSIDLRHGSIQRQRVNVSCANLGSLLCECRLQSVCGPCACTCILTPPQIFTSVGAPVRAGAREARWSDNYVWEDECDDEFPYGFRSNEYDWEGAFPDGFPPEPRFPPFPTSPPFPNMETPATTEISATTETPMTTTMETPASPSDITETPATTAPPAIPTPA